MFVQHRQDFMVGSMSPWAKLSKNAGFFLTEYSFYMLLKIYGRFIFILDSHEK